MAHATCLQDGSGGTSGAGSVPAGDGVRGGFLAVCTPLRLRHVWLVDLAEHSKFARRQV